MVTKFVTYKVKGELVQAVEELEKLPETYKKKPHVLVQDAIIFTAIISDLRRGREGIADLRKEHYAKKIDYQTGQEYFQRIAGQETKNHKLDKQDVSQSGIIPKYPNTYSSFNPGLLFENFLDLLNKQNEFLFQKPKQFPNRDALLLSNCWFDNQKVGKNRIGAFLPTLMKKLSLPSYTNHSLRGTGIRLLKRFGLEDRAISKLSGHKSLESLAHYDPDNTFTTKGKISSILFQNKGKSTEETTKQDPSHWFTESTKTDGIKTAAQQLEHEENMIIMGQIQLLMKRRA